MQNSKAESNKEHARCESEYQAWVAAGNKVTTELKTNKHIFKIKTKAERK